MNEFCYYHDFGTLSPPPHPSVSIVIPPPPLPPQMCYQHTDIRSGKCSCSDVATLRSWCMTQVKYVVCKVLLCLLVLLLLEKTGKKGKKEKRWNKCTQILYCITHTCPYWLFTYIHYLVSYTQKQTNFFFFQNESLQVCQNMYDFQSSHSRHRL